MILAFKRSRLRLIRWAVWLLILVPVMTTSAQSNGIDRIATGGNFYTAASFDQTIYIWNSAKQQLLFTITPDETEFTYRVSDLVFNPDGTLLAASFGGGDLLPGVVRVYDVSTGKIVLEFDAWTNAGDLAWKPDGTQLAARAASGLGTQFSTHLNSMEYSIRFVGS